ncbi:MAG TPA: hypothetical protein VMR52_13460 [Dehalococcoidia bacterium]|nr:hypothetical protein [Dehalococcoidia bacterium]
MSSNPGLIRPFQAVAGIVALLVFVQAILAGQFLTGGENLVDIHEIVGNVIFLGAAVQLALAYLTRDFWRYRMVIWSVVILALVVSQIGLGYVGREELDARAIHVPLGVFLFSLTSIVAMLSAMDERAKDALRGPAP